ncbi:hypothetical protein HPB48_010496 [Haemaphysalis longicornis]|uniref:GCM domain-containing protein n=1 Tax=Haemaphysalis longicornis TaxID=44386 RepID=A0A9J6FMN5_HAELO|nr:hypothetical protein HPB48_010496 [Haemaphysalis longicornis]
MTEACDTGPVHNHADWDIEDSFLPQVTNFDEYNKWPDGNCRYVYRPESVEAKRHCDRMGDAPCNGSQTAHHPKDVRRRSRMQPSVRVRHGTPRVSEALCHNRNPQEAGG